MVSEAEKAKIRQMSEDFDKWVDKLGLGGKDEI